ncbi:hypothetical protein CWI39_1120p0020 [Hamiltosporidium magnivora]|uniref:Uncharacterized protein n=1 Tax=Hamiltosporidium magnivora TaxID=148818 RepID=A0A4Q9L4Y9_9MICR|nr:hypothetical protein CWI39_1120p0020 [Hamiltosporidium magnivora]
MEKKALYALLGKVYEDCPRKYIQFLLGDMDAKIGKDYVCSRIRNYNLHKEHPENGFRLLNFAIRGNLILGTVFDRGNIHKDQSLEFNKQIQIIAYAEGIDLIARSEASQQRAGTKQQGTLHRIKVYANSRFSLPEQTSLGRTPPKNENIAYLLKFRTLYQSEKESGKTDNWLDYSNQKTERFLGVEDWWNIALEKDWINKYKVWSDNGDSMDRGSNHKSDSDCKGVSDTIDDYKGVITYTNTLHPVNTNTSHPVNTNSTTFTLWNSFVFGEYKLSEILKYFKRVWNVDISMVTIRDTVVFFTFYDNERFKNNLEKLIRYGVIYCGIECLFDIDGYNFPEVFVDFRREKGEVLGLV